VRYFLFVIPTILLLMVFSCKKKEKVVFVEKETIVYKDSVHHWTPVAKFESYPTSKNIGNAKNIGNYVLFVGNTFSGYDSLTDKFMFWSPINPNEYQKTPLITNDFWISCMYGSVLMLNPTRELYSGSFGGSNSFQFWANNYDKKFESYSFTNAGWWWHPEIIATDKNKIFVPARDTSGYPIVYALSVKVRKNYPFNGVDKIDTSSCKKIKFPNKYEMLRPIGTIGENALYNLNVSGTYKIDYKNDTTWLFNNRSLYDIFKFNSTYYAIGQEAATTKLFSTSDSGSTWQVQYSNLPWEAASFNYFEMGNRIIATYHYQIFEVVIGSNLIYKELDNDGIKYNDITSIVKCNGKVFLTTNYGVYTCNYSDFFKYK
jgi:hypothetical protein